MVNVAFIVEGDTESIICSSQLFKAFLSSLNLVLVGDIQNAGGNGNLLPQNINTFITNAKKHAPEYIFVITDADENTVDIVRERIKHDGIDYIFVAVKAFEAWFFADSSMLSVCFNTPYSHTDPESINKPFEELSALFCEKTGRGLSSKVLGAKKMIKFGFSFDRAAKHENCKSLKEFCEHLRRIANS